MRWAIKSGYLNSNVVLTGPTGETVTVTKEYLAETRQQVEQPVQCEQQQPPSGATIPPAFNLQEQER